jgi:hypothetical protein
MDSKTEFSQHVQALLAATTPAAVGVVYEKMVGYDSHLEDPAAALETLRWGALLYVREWCFENRVHPSTVGLILPLYLYEHRSFPRMLEAEELLALGWTDTSWHNNTCPSFWTADKALCVWIEHPEPAGRENPEHRYVVTVNDEEIGNFNVLLATNDWAEVLRQLDDLHKQALAEIDEPLIAEATEAALDAACKVIQDHLKVTEGDFAGLFFSGDAADPIKAVLRRYMADQRADEQRVKDSGFTPL